MNLDRLVWLSSKLKFGSKPTSPVSHPHGSRGYKRSSSMTWSHSSLCLHHNCGPPSDQVLSTYCKAKASNMNKSNMHEIVMYTPSIEMRRRQVNICEWLSNKPLSSTRKVLYFLLLYDRERQMTLILPFIFLWKDSIGLLKREKHWVLFQIYYPQNDC